MIDYCGEVVFRRGLMNVLAAGLLALSAPQSPAATYFDGENPDPPPSSNTDGEDQGTTSPDIDGEDQGSAGPNTDGEEQGSAHPYAVGNIEGSYDPFADGSDSLGSGTDRQIQPIGQGSPENKVNTVSVARALALSAYQICQLMNEYRQTHNVQLAGFSTTMTGWVLYMACADRQRTRRLVRDMTALDTRQERLAWLRQELRAARAFETNLALSVKRVREKRLWNAVNEESARLSNLRGFIAGLDVWIDFPHEGTR